MNSYVGMTMVKKQDDYFWQQSILLSSLTLISVPINFFTITIT